LSSINLYSREVSIKIVYYGPGLGGKTSSLQVIHRAIKADARGQLVSLATGADRTLYFDFLPVKLPKLRGYTIRVQLYTVPGQVHYNSTRKLVLANADGLVFVADSQPARAQANKESLDNLIENLKEQGQTLAEIPHLYQYNKRDAPDVMSVADMNRELNADNAPTFETSCVTGQGVFEALKSITTLVLADLRRRGIWRAPAVPNPESELPEERAETAGVVRTPTAEHSDSIAASLQALAEQQAQRAVPELTLQPLRPEAQKNPPPIPHGTSFAELLPAGTARDAVVSIEYLVQRADYANAVVSAVRLFDDGAVGGSISAGEGPAMRALALGRPADRYLRFRDSAGRAQGGAASSEDALFALFFLVDASLRSHR
jgi:signal recognition particle receptor subunit beta